MTVADCHARTNVTSCHGDLMTAEPRFRPGDVERLAGVDTDTQRDWRRRGFLEEYGDTQGTGRWAYSLQDLVGFYMSRRLMETGMDRQDATVVAFLHGPVVLALMQDRPAAYRFAVRVIGPDQDGSEQKQTFKRIDKLGDLDGLLFDRAEVIDLAGFAVLAPPDLLEVARFWADRGED